MFRKFVDEWLNMEQNKEADDIGMFEAAVLYDFAHWLDSRSPTLRAPVRNEQKCPSCKADCLPIADGLEHFCPACGTSLGISKRSLGG